MAAPKIDKEFLLKYHFWILSGVFVLLWVVLVSVVFASSGNIDAERKKFDQKKKDLDTAASQAVNDTFAAPWRKKEENLRKRKEKVWENAWEGQKNLMTWPADDSLVTFTHTMGPAYFGDALSDELRRAFPDYYPKQLAFFTQPADSASPYPTPIAPAYYNGNNYDNVLHLRREMKNPDKKDVWLAQEDFWVKRELVKVIRDAIDGAAKFRKVEPAERVVPAAAAVAGALAAPAAGALYTETVPAPAKAEAALRYRSAEWQLDLIVEKNAKGQLQVSPDSTITNVSADHRMLFRAGVLLQIGYPGEDPADLLIEGDPLAWGKSDKVKTAVPLAGLFGEKPLEVRQYFNWYTSPVKRLDRIEVGNTLAVAHRFAHRPLMLAKQFPEEPAAETDSGTKTPGPPGQFNAGGPPGGVAAGPSGTPPGGFRPGGLPPNGPGGPAAPDKKRYVDATPQVRLLPVAMVVIVDQAHVPDVLAAVSNSNLKLWTTQVTWSHASGVTPPPELEKDNREASGAEGNPSERPGPMVPPKGPPGVPMSPSKGRPGFPPGYFGQPGMGGTGAAVEQDDPNLVELVVYAIASLYERYPPKPDQPKTTP
jgi:hypothetical protein